MTHRHLVDIASLGVDTLRHIVALSRSHDVQKEKPLANAGVGLIFEKPSNRTRHSMEMAVVQLGGHPIYTRGEEIGFDVRESVEDVTRIMAGYHRVLAARVFSHSVIERMVACDVTPVINMLSDVAHPLQALADIITMEDQCGEISWLSVAWTGDYNNVARSFSEAVLMLGGTMSLGCPSGFNADAGEMERLEKVGGNIRQSADPVEAVKNVNVVHTDTWISMGQEAEAIERRKIFSSYCVTQEMMQLASPGAKFMHCMPAHRGEEVAADVFDSPSSLVIAQGHHR
ncbi:MAG: ornithine carbamoyltransferase, partial [Actinobacteria bacterium]|nr:ornithine carbamoyltransferase [Actinomycetota bacterium]